MTALLLLLLSCGGKKNLPTADWDTQSLAEAAWGREVPAALKAGYRVSVDAPSLGIKGSTRGALLVHRPDKFRLEIYSPLGSPLVYMASDGVAASLYLFTQNTWMGTDQAEETLRDLTGGAAGLEDLISLIVGQLPFPDSEILGSARTDKELVQYTFGTSAGGRAEVTLRERDLTTRQLSAYDESGKLVLEADYNDYMKLEKSRLPKKLVLVLPGINMTLEMDFDRWKELEVVPDSFSVPAPPRSKKVDLHIMLQKAREAREEGIQPASLEELTD